MGKQQDAPGQLEIVRSFVNSVDLEDEIEELGSPRALATWLAAHDLAGGETRVTRADLDRAIGLREALRAVLLSHNGGPNAPAGAVSTLDDAARRARVQLRFREGVGTVLEPDAGGVDGALGRLLAIVHASIADGSWNRLKACREDSCEWAFYDHTKNRSGAWCNMGVCGNRAKARAFRERRASRSSA
jgi:predicted RNA-binding Zn ribbon-like protein